MAKKGEKMSDEYKRKIGLGNKGKPNFFKGKKRPKETRKKMSVNNPKFWLGKKLYPETKKKMSEARKGEKNGMWKGGITPMFIKIRQSPEGRLWRLAVFARDNYTCIFCGARSGNGKSIKLNADHIKPFCDYPELRFAIDNGRTLCEDCHKKTPTYGNRKK